MKRIALHQFYRGLVSRLRLTRTEASAPFTYVALGDSTVEGIGASSPARTYSSVIYSNIKLSHKKALHYNFGKSGARVKDVLDTQLDKTIALRPNLVTISVGPNDIIHHTKLSVFRERLTRLVETLQKETGAIIVMTNVPNFSLMRVVPLPLKPVAKFQINRFNKCILEVANSHDVVHIDTYQQSTVFAKSFPEAVCQDNFHPSDFGYALWGNTIITTIQDKLSSLQQAPSVKKTA